MASTTPVKRPQPDWEERAINLADRLVGEEHRPYNLRTESRKAAAERRDPAPGARDDASTDAKWEKDAPRRELWTTIAWLAPLRENPHDAFTYAYEAEAAWRAAADYAAAASLRTQPLDAFFLTAVLDTELGPLLRAIEDLERGARFFFSRNRAVAARVGLLRASAEKLRQARREAACGAYDSREMAQRLRDAASIGLYVPSVAFLLLG